MVLKWSGGNLEQTGDGVAWYRYECCDCRFEMSFCELSVEKLDEKMLQFQMGMDSSCLFSTIVHT